MNMPPAVWLALAFAAALLVSGAAWRLRALSRSGAMAATLVGGFALGFGGLTWAAVLLSFFVFSSGLSFWQSARKEGATREHARGKQRDVTQVLANGGLAAGLALLVGVLGHDHALYPWLTVAYFGALSAAAADTWATEIGMLSPLPPRLITSGQVVTAGQSGGVSRLGLLASLGGGLTMGLSAFAIIQLASLITNGTWFLQDWFLLPVAAFAGLGGSVVDSLLGASLQYQAFCPQCRAVSERHVHVCGHPTEALRGLAWMNNDVVNFLATVAGASLAVLASWPFIAL